MVSNAVFGILSVTGWPNVLADCFFDLPGEIHEFGGHLPWMQTANQHLAPNAGTKCDLPDVQVATGDPGFDRRIEPASIDSAANPTAGRPSTDHP